MYKNTAVPLLVMEQVTRLVPVLEHDLFFLDDMLRAGAAIDDGEKGMAKKGKVLE